MNLITNLILQVDVKTTDEGLSAFMVSCIIGDVQIAELLLARGASIHSTALESKLEIFYTEVSG